MPGQSKGDCVDVECWFDSSLPRFCGNWFGGSSLKVKQCILRLKVTLNVDNDRGAIRSIDVCQESEIPTHNPAPVSTARETGALFVLGVVLCMLLWGWRRLEPGILFSDFLLMCLEKTNATPDEGFDVGCVNVVGFRNNESSTSGASLIGTASRYKACT